MDGDCGSISMDRYWNTIGTPFFFIVLGFGLFVLFSMNNIQLASNQHIFNIVAGVLQSGPPSKTKRPAPPPELEAPEPEAPEELEAPVRAPAPNVFTQLRKGAEKQAAARAAKAAARPKVLPGAAAERMPQSEGNARLNSAERGPSKLFGTDRYNIPV